jgi:uncharacterized protein (TIGR02001 family)
MQRCVTMALATAAVFGVAAFAGLAAQAQVLQGTADRVTRAIGLGDRALAGTGAPRAPAAEGESLQFTVKGGFATDYVYRGTTLSDRKPAVGAGVEAAFSWLYAAVTVASVELPTQPSSEIAVGGGIRPKLGSIELDLGVTYFLYPNEMPGGLTNGIDYAEAAIRAVTPIGESIRVGAGYAYAPNVSNTGAWSQYAAAGVGYQVPSQLLPQDFGIAVTAAAGYSWFGNQAPVLGGFPLPAYLNWQAGITFSYKMFNLDVRYHDTNLSHENCYVLTGDPGATPGGRVDPITNPDGLLSRWCSAAIVAKVGFEVE